MQWGIPDLDTGVDQSGSSLVTMPAATEGWDSDLDRMHEDYLDNMAGNGPFAPGDTLFAVGHHTEDRLVWFDILTVTLDDIMSECGFPEEQREQHSSQHRFFAEYFLRHYEGPEKTVPLLEDQSAPMPVSPLAKAGLPLGTYNPKS